MRIGIDGYNLAMANGTGVATYGRTLARVLAAGGHRIEGVFGLDSAADPAVRETMFFDDLGRDLAIGSSAWRRRRRAVRRAALWPFQRATARDVPFSAHVERVATGDRLPAFDRIVTSPRLYEIAHRHFAIHGRFVRLHVPDPPEIMHWTYPVPVTMAGARNIVTLHDLVPLRLPHTTLDDKPIYRRLVTACAESADHVCTVSEASRSDIVELLGVDPDRVTNCYQSSIPGGDTEALDAALEAAEVENVLGLRPQGYFLYFGATEPKKNIGRLIEAYLSLGTETPLVLVGGRAWRSEAELILLTQEPEGRERHAEALRRRVVQFDHLPRHLLLKVIRQARAVTFPSILEGFGLPVLEAMQLGTPVLTSDIGALREVAGEAAVLVDPYDIRAIANGLRRLDGDEALRLRLSAAGRRQAEHFSAEHYRRRLEAMYGRVLAGGR